MSTRRVLSLICLLLFALLIGNLFLPNTSDGDISYSLWKSFSNDGETVLIPIIVLVELILGVVICLLQTCGVIEDSKISFFSIGFILTYYISNLITMVHYEQAQYLSVGFYLGFIISIITFILLLIGSFVSNKKKPRVYANYAPQGPQIVGYDPKTGKPIYR